MHLVGAYVKYEVSHGQGRYYIVTREELKLMFYQKENKIKSERETETDTETKRETETETEM